MSTFTDNMSLTDVSAETDPLMLAEERCVGGLSVSPESLSQAKNIQSKLSNFSEVEKRQLKSSTWEKRDSSSTSLTALRRGGL